MNSNEHTSSQGFTYEFEGQSEIQERLRQVSSDAGRTVATRSALRALIGVTSSLMQISLSASEASKVINSFRNCLVATLNSRAMGSGTFDFSRDVSEKDLQASRLESAKPEMLDVSFSASQTAAAVSSLSDLFPMFVVSTVQTSANLGFLIADSIESEGRVVSDVTMGLSYEFLFWKAVAGDLNFLDKSSQFEDLLSEPIWLPGTQGEIQDAPEFLVKILKEKGEWQFWGDWYAGILAGKPLDWELQIRVAKIPEAIWNAGPEIVAREIKLVEAAYLSEQFPLAETIELNRGTRKFYAVPIPFENAPYMSALLSQIGDALEDCLGGHNGLSGASSDVKKLNRVLTKYHDDPQNAELTLTRVAGSLRAQLYESRELPDNEDNLGLLNAVEEGVRGIRANHPEVAANREQLAQQAFQALEPEEKKKLEEALPVLAEITDPNLAEDFEQDIPELINDALLPLPDGVPPLPGADVATRVFSRVSKMALVWEKYEKAKRAGAEAWDSDLVKTLRLAGFAIGGVTGVSAVLYGLVQIGLRLLGVL